jgi:hypothetical protein
LLPRHLGLQWSLAFAVIACGSYAAFGLPPLLVGRRKVAADGSNDLTDVRSRWASATLSKGGWVAFVVATLIGGPAVIAWWFVRAGSPAARRLTAISALLFGVVWTTVYVGIAGWVL